MSGSFSDFALREPLQRALDEAGFTEPTPIQRRAIPILLEGRDLIGVAQTGTGKTLAYLLPIFQRLDVEKLEPQAIVVCPTRELAQQVGGEAERFGAPLGARCVVAYGGTSSGGQKQGLRDGCHVLVATPGRLLDFVTSAWISMRPVRTVVLDEADRMLDMGFIRDIDAIMRKAPMSRQTMLFSATFPDEVRSLAERYTFHPERVEVSRGRQVKDTIDHTLYPVHPSQKADLLVQLMRRQRPAKTLIFTATREGTSELALQLRRSGFEVLSMSSLLSQANRERALASFRSGASPVLVATDVAARGLDITDIDFVVNFDVPMHAEDYVHRIGRTGRADRSGRAVTLITADDGRRVREIERLLGYAVERKQIEGFDYRAERPSASRGGGGRGRDGRRRKSGDSGDRRKRSGSRRRRRG